MVREVGEILLVEDEVWLAQLYQMLFGAAGYQAHWCADCYDAIDWLDTHQISLIILDVFLPWANGIQLLHELASHADLAAIPVILSTSVASDLPDQSVLKVYGVSHVFDKANMEPKQLLAMAREVIDGR